MLKQQDKREARERERAVLVNKRLLQKRVALTEPYLAIHGAIAALSQVDTRHTHTRTMLSEK